MNKVEKQLRKKGADLGKLMTWLQMPSQGILPQVASAVIIEVAEEFAEKKNWHLESLMYPEGYRKLMAKGKLPEHFWVDHYILERCRWVQEDMIKGHNLDIDPVNFVDRLDKIRDDVRWAGSYAYATYKLVKPIRDFLTIPRYVRFIFGGFISYSYRRIVHKFRRS